MNRDKGNRGLSQDRKRVAGGQDYEVDYLMKKCNCSRDEVLAAIEKVGNSRERLVELLTKGNSGARPR